LFLLETNRNIEYLSRILIRSNMMIVDLKYILKHFSKDCAEKKLINRNIFILKDSTVNRDQSPSQDREQIIFKIVWKTFFAIIADREKEKFIKYQICWGTKLSSLLWIFLSKINDSVMKYCHPKTQKIPYFMSFQ